MRNKIFSILLVLFLFVSCTNNTDKKESVDEKAGKDTYVIGQTRVITDTDPLNSSWSITASGISEYVYQIDKDGKLQSRFLDDMKKENDLEWSFAVKNGVKFSDGSDVTIDSLIECLNYIQENNKLSNATAGKIVFSNKDGRLYAKTERKARNLQSVLAEWTNVVFKKDGENFVYTGPYKVDELDSGTELKLSPNEYYDEKSKDRKNVIIKAFKDEATMKMAFLSGEIDMIFPITPELKKQIDNDGKITKSIDAGYQYFAMVNVTNGVMNDLKFREAINLYLDRNDYINALDGGRIPTGTFAYYYDFNGDVKIENDKEKAVKILEELGYIKNKNGKFEKDGKEIELNIATLSFRKDLVILSQVMASQLETLGINVKVVALDNAENIDKDSGYDILLYAQHTAPTGEPSFFLNQFFRTGEGKNKFGFSSQKIDKLLDEMSEKEDNIEIVKEIQQEIYNELPIFYIIDPEWHMALSEDLKDYEIYCGDYFVINDKLGVN